MNVTTADVRSLAEVRLTDAAAVGPKAAKLGEMLRAGLPVPPGFVVTADAYLRSMEAAGCAPVSRCAMPTRSSAVTPWA